MIIPLFIPHAGCPHQCVFCNQNRIAGRQAPKPSELAGIIDRHLRTAPASSDHQVAFYGGTFTALPLDQQTAYLDAALPFVRSGRIRSIRLSTRPDALDHSVLALLASRHVSTIELGVQSMNDRVLEHSGRGHSAADTIAAVRLLKEHNFTIGLQLMPGLPGDSPETFLETVAQTIGLEPDFVRIYPTLVIAGTPLERLHAAGRFTPHALDEAVAVCSRALLLYEQAGIEVIRIGLQPSEELEKHGTVIAGPYHPAFRQLVESSIMLERMRTALIGATAESAVLLVNPADLSAAIGQKRSNLERLQQEFGRKVRIRTDNRVPRRHAKPGT